MRALWCTLCLSYRILSCLRCALYLLKLWPNPTKHPALWAKKKNQMKQKVFSSFPTQRDGNLPSQPTASTKRVAFVKDDPTSRLWAFIKLHGSGRRPWRTLTSLVDEVDLLKALLGPLPPKPKMGCFWPKELDQGPVLIGPPVSWPKETRGLETSPTNPSWAKIGGSNASFYLIATNLLL